MRRAPTVVQPTGEVAPSRQQCVLATTMDRIVAIRSFALRVVVSILCTGSGVLAQQPAKHRVTLDDLKNFKEVAQMQLSPDGQRLAYTVWDHTELWVVNTQRGSVPQKIGTGTAPVWSPDGRYLAYYSSGTGLMQFMVYDTKTARTDQVTHVAGGIQPDAMTGYIGMDGGITDPQRFAWSPDGTRIVFHSKVATSRGRIARVPTHAATLHDSGQAAAPLVLTAATPPDWTLAGIFRGFSNPHWVNGKFTWTDSSTGPQTVTTDQLFIADIHTKTVRQLTTDESGYFSPDWSPDGRQIVCLSNEGRTLRGWGSGPTNIYLIDVATGAKTALTADSVYKRVPAWSPDGQMVAFYGATSDNFGRVSLFVIPRGGGVPVNVSAKLDRRISDAWWAADSRSIVALYQDGVNYPIAQLGVPNGDVVVISDSEDAVRMSLTVSQSGAAAWSQSDPSGPDFIRLRPKEGGPSYVVVDLNPEIQALQLGTQEVVRWKDGHGNEMEGVLVKPVGYEAGRRYPLIIDAYPQQSNSFKAWPMEPGQAWASRGYAVFYPDVDGPHVWMNPWKSIANKTAAKGPKGVEVTVDDVLSGVDELIRRGVVDGDRMCLYGFSNGGAVVNQVVTKSDRFKCAVSVAGALSGDWLMPFFLQTQAKFIPDIVGATPWQDPQAYFELSALYRLDKVTTPVLLADGDNDDFFLLGTIEMYNGLRYLGKDVTFLRYPNQEHGFTGAAMKDFWERENAFFAKYLAPETPAS